MSLPAKRRGPCAPDINADGALNILDFIAFQTAWQAGEAGADCDDDSRFTLLNFACYNKKAFQSGCP